MTTLVEPVRSTPTITRPPGDGKAAASLGTTGVGDTAGAQAPTLAVVDPVTLVPEQAASSIPVASTGTSARFTDVSSVWPRGRATSARQILSASPPLGR